MPQLEYAATSSWMHLKLFLPHFQLRCQFVTNYKSDCETNPCVKIFKGNVWEIPSLFLSTLPPFEKIKRVRGQRERNWCRESGNEKVGACLRPPCPRYLGDGGMLPLTQGSASFWPAGQIWSLLVFINKVYWDTAMLIRLCILCGCFQVTMQSWVVTTKTTKQKIVTTWLSSEKVLILCLMRKISGATGNVWKCVFCRWETEDWCLNQWAAKAAH